LHTPWFILFDRWSPELGFVLNFSRGRNAWRMYDDWNFYYSGVVPHVAYHDDECDEDYPHELRFSLILHILYTKRFTSC